LAVLLFRRGWRDISRASRAAVGKLAQVFNRTSAEIRRAIELAKQANPPGGPIKNPDVDVDTTTGEIYPKGPNGTHGDSIGNIYDYLP
jgi:hypothetical protein